MYKQEIIKQHYVSWFYLKNWRGASTTGQQGIWTKRGAQTPFLAQGRNKTARIDHFYRVTVDDVVLDMMRYKYAFDPLHGIVKNVLQDLETLTCVTEYMAKKMPFHERLEIINSNYLENKYGVLEDVISRNLAKLVKGQWQNLLGTASALHSTYDSFLGFYAIQYFRTAHTRDRLREEITTIVLERDGCSTVLSEGQKDTLLKLIAYVESIRLFDQLRRARPLIEICKSQCISKFLTSDAPAQLISFKADEKKQFLEYHGLMPLSPSHSMSIRKNRQTPARITVSPGGELEVSKINQRFVRHNMGANVYSTSRDALFHLRIMCDWTPTA